MPEKHILHIEDNFHNRRIVRKILEKQGYLLHEAADGVIGFNMIQEMKPPMVLLDISLPGMDGIEIAQKVKGDDDLKHIILIAVTASAMQGDRERFLAAGCDDYLSKPFRSIDLLDLVNQYYAEIPESYMSSFKPKDVIHPSEEHFVMAEPEAWPPAKQAQEEIPEPLTPITEETLAEEERQFFTSEEETPQTEEPTGEPTETLPKSDLLKTASLEGLFSNEELDEYMEDEPPSEEEVEAAEEAPESKPAMAFTGETESEEEEDDEETVTWVMPRNAMETPPVEEEHPMEEPSPEPAEPAEPLEDGEVPYYTFLEEISNEDALDESPIEETPEPAVTEESEETTQVWQALSKPDGIELDTDFLRPAVLEEAPDEDLMEETPEPAVAEESEAPAAETLLEGVEMQAETSEEEESDEIIQTWRTPDKTDELVLDTDFLQPSALEETPKEDKEELAPTIVSPTEVVEKLMSLAGEEPAAVTEPDLEEEPTKPVTSLEEMATSSPEDEDVLQAETATEAEEEVAAEPASSLYDEIDTLRVDADETMDVEKELEAEDTLAAETAPEAEEEALTEPAVSPDDEIETIRIDAGEAWSFEKELEAEDTLGAETAPEADEEALTEPAGSPDDEIETLSMGAGEAWGFEKELEAEDASGAETAPEAEEEALAEPAASPDDEIETLSMDAGEAWDVEKELEAEDASGAETAPEAEEEAPPEPVAVQDRMVTTALEAEDVLLVEPLPEAEVEAVAEPAASPDDEIETIRIDAGEDGDVEKELEVEETEVFQETAKRSRLDDTSPLREEVLEASMAEEPRSESPSNGSGREEQSPKKEEKSAQKNDLTDQVVRMINPEMIRPVDPNVGV